MQCGTQCYVYLAASLEEVAKLSSFFYNYCAADYTNTPANCMHAKVLMRHSLITVLTIFGVLIVIDMA